MEKEISDLKIAMARVETKQDIIIKKMPDKGTIMERLKIHSWLITVLYGSIIGIAIFIIRKQFI